MRSFALSALAVSSVAVAGQPTVLTIDAFTDAFESETFAVTSGGLVQSLASEASLDAGRLNLPGGAGVGDPAPASVVRPEERQTQLGLAGVLGGQRTGVAAIASAEGRVTAEIAGGSLTITHDGAAASSLVELSYHAAAFRAEFGAILFDVTRPPGFTATTDATVTLTDADGASHAVTQRLDVARPYFFNVLDFQQAVDLDRISGIGVAFHTSSPDPASFTIANLRFEGVIPAPASGVGLLIGMAAIARRRR